MMRSILGLVVLVLLFAPVGVAGEAKYVASIPPEQVARRILEGRQTFIAQYLEQATADELLRIQRAICQLAPEVVDQARARPSPPSIKETPDGPLELVNIEARVIQASKGSGFFRDVGIQWGGESDLLLLDEAQVEVILRAIEKSERLQQITAPRISVYDRQRANVSVLNQISYVMDHEIEISNGAFISDPIIGVVQEGLLLDFTPTISKDKQYISLELAATYAEIRKPMLEHTIECGAPAEGQRAKIQVPQTDLTLASLSARLPSGGTMLVRTGTSSGAGKEAVERFVLVRATVVEIDGGALRRELEDVEKKLKDDRRAPAGK